MFRNKKMYLPKQVASIPVPQSTNLRPNDIKNLSALFWWCRSSDPPGCLIRGWPSLHRTSCLHLKIKTFPNFVSQKRMESAASKTSMPEELLCKMAPTYINVLFVSVRGKCCIFNVQIFIGTSPLVSVFQLPHESFVLDNTYVVTHLSFQPWNGIRSHGNVRNWVQGTDKII